MSDNGEADTEEPAVPLGEGDPVEGAPTARIASRLYFPIEESEVLRREGETTIRTPAGPRDLADVLAESDEVYFPDRQSFVDTVQDVVGNGPIPTAGDDGSAGGDGASPDEEDEVEAADGDADAEDGAPDAEAEDAEPGEGEPENAAEAPEGEVEGSPDEDNAAEAADDEGGDAETPADEDDEAPADESPADEGEFEFNDPEE